MRSASWLLAVAYFGATVAAGSARAAVLTFDGAEDTPIASDYGSRLVDTPNVTVSYSPEFRYWGSGYANLSNVAWAVNTAADPDVATITLTADPGYRVSLASFDMAGYEADQFLDTLEVLVDGVSTFSRPSVTLQGAAGDTADRFTPNLTGQTIMIRYTDSVQGGTESIDYVAIDNITFTQVPEPAATLLPVGVALAGLLRRRAHRR